MANYRYIAKTSAGESVEGVMQADSEAAVLRTLGDRDLFPIQVSTAEVSERQLGGGKVRKRDVGTFFGQMSDMLRSGVPLLRTLETLIKASTNQALAEVVRGLRDSVAKGQTLANSMAEFPRAFSSLHVAMVRAGEEAGFLEDVLENLAAFVERQDELRSKVRGMLIYPVVLSIIGVIMLLGIMLLVVPKFKEFFVGIDLPLPTRVIFTTSDILSNHFSLAIALAVLAGIGIWAFRRSEMGRGIFEKLRMNLPFLGKVNRAVGIARFSRIFGTMLHNGVPILHALEISKDAAGSQIIADQIAAAAENVRAGEPLAEPLRQFNTFPPEVIEMIAVAEESNQMDKVLVQVADKVERQTNQKVDAVVRLIEPLILMLLAVTIGFVAAGLLYPIFTMAETLSE